MEVNGQLEAAAALPLGTKPPLTREYQAGRDFRPCVDALKKENFQPCCLTRPTHILVSTPTELSHELNNFIL
jgi:predicted 2-oxoglutarate/Fe(II)-dependent dioxygenase YbiX